MVGRGEANQARAKRSSSRYDRISQLPDSLICQILSHLPTKDIVKTSILSTRWKSLWLSVPRLELAWWHTRDFYAFVSFGDRFFDPNRVSCLHSLKLYLDESDAFYLTPWIDALVKRKIQSLNVRRTRGDYFHEMPLSIYACETLVSLKLYQLTLLNAEFVSLPCLKILRLKDIVFPNEATFERLVSSCPVLEDLKIHAYWKDGTVYRVRSRSLKKLSLLRSSSHSFHSVPGVVIDAPLLCCLNIDDRLSESFIVNKLQSNVKLDIDLHFGLKDFDVASVSSRRSCIRSFLSGISKVMDMKISAETFKIIHRYSKLEPLPQFDYMSYLHATLYVSDLKGFLTFRESCPNLKSLILTLDSDFDQMRSEEMNQLTFLSGISRVIDMTIYPYTFELIYQYSNLKPLPQFGYMSRLYVLLRVSTLKWLPTFLESCPNLKSLTLSLDFNSELMSSEEMDQISLSSVPECVLSSLEFVKFSTSFSGHAAEMKLVRYFLKNSAILKKLTLRFYCCPRKDDIFKELLKIPRRSTICQVVVL